MGIVDTTKALVKGTKIPEKPAVPEPKARKLPPELKAGGAKVYDPDQALAFFDVDAVKNYTSRTTTDANGYAMAAQSAVTPEQFFRILGQKPLSANDFTPQELELYRSAIENGEFGYGIPNIKGTTGADGIFEPDLSSVSQEQVDMMNVLYLDKKNNRVPVSFNFGDSINDKVPMPTYVKSANGKLVSMPDLPQLSKNPRLEYKFNGKAVDDPRLGTMYTERMDSKSVIKYIFDPDVNRLHGNLADTMAMGGGRSNSSKAWDSYVDIYREDGYMPPQVDGFRVEDIYDESLSMDIQAFTAMSPTVQQRIRNTRSPYTRELLGDKSADKGLGLLFFRHDASPMTDNGMTLAENKPLEGGPHMGIYYAYNNFKMRTDFSEAKPETKRNWNDLQKAVKLAFPNTPIEEPKQAPIVRYREIAKEIESKLPPVQEGYVRLWRGNRKGEVGENPSFTNSLDGIALPFKEAYGGPLSYIDVKAEEVDSYLQTGVVAPGAEFRLPPELAKLAKEVPEITEKKKSPTTIRKEVGKIMGQILREEYPDLNSSPAQRVDVDAEWHLWDNGRKAARIRRFSEAMSPYTDKATAEDLARLIENQMRQHYRELDTAYIITGENPVPLWDKGSFHEGVIVDQLLEKKEFAPWKAELEDLSYDLMDENDPAYGPALKRQWEIVVEAGYDPYGLYVNRAEGGGAPSIVVAPGAIDRIGTKVMRSGTDYAQKLRDGRLAAIGLGFIEEDE